MSRSSESTTPKTRYCKHEAVCNPHLYLEDQKFQGQHFPSTHAETDRGVNKGFTVQHWQKKKKTNYSHQHLSAKISTNKHTWNKIEIYNTNESTVWVFFKYPKQLQVAQASVCINCPGHRFIYLWLRKEFPAQRLSKEQPSPVLHGHLGQLTLPFLILMLMQFKQPSLAFFMHAISLSLGHLVVSV